MNVIISLINQGHNNISVNEMYSEIGSWQHKVLGYYSKVY